MVAGIAVRAALTLLFALACLGAWKLLGRSVLARARRAPVGAGSLPDGFVPGRPGILVFGSPHCAPCVYAQRPAARRLEKELGGAIQLIEVDVDEEPGIAARYGVLSLPSVFVYDAEGRPRRINHGLVSFEELGRQIAPYLA